MALDRAVRNGEKKLRCICGLLFRFKFMQEKMFHIGYVLAETVIFRISADRIRNSFRSSSEIRFLFLMM